MIARLVFKYATSVALTATASLIFRLSSGSLGLHKWPATGGFAEAHNDEAGHDKDPVDIVRNDGPVCRRVCPAKNGIEDAPGFVAACFGRAALIPLLECLFISVRIYPGETYIDVPDTIVNII